MSLLASIFCPLCQIPYGNSQRRPRRGDCSHSACEACLDKKENDTTCPVCGKIEAFKVKILNYTLIGALKTFKEKMTERSLKEASSNPKTLNFGTCSNSDCTETRNLRMCVTCAEASGLIEKMSDGKWQLKEENKAIHLAKTVFLCANCILENRAKEHLGHEILPFSAINRIDLDLEHWFYLAQAYCLDEKYYDELQTSGFLQTKILEFKRELIEFDLLSKKRLQRFEVLDVILNMKFLKNIDVHTVPALAKAKNVVWQKAQETIDRFWKVQERTLRLRQKQVAHYLDGYGLRPDKTEAEKEIWKEFKDQMAQVTKMFNSYSITELTPEESEQIDEELKMKLETKMRNLELFDEKDVKKLQFFRYKALCALLKESSEATDGYQEKANVQNDKSGKMTADRKRRFEKSFENSEKSVEDQLTMRLFLFEITEESFKIDKMLLEALQGSVDYLEARLLWLLYFPEKIDDKSEESFYNMVLLQQFPKGDASLRREFSLSMHITKY